MKINDIKKYFFILNFKIQHNKSLLTKLLRYKEKSYLHNNIVISDKNRFYLPFEIFINDIIKLKITCFYSTKTRKIRVILIKNDIAIIQTIINTDMKLLNFIKQMNIKYSNRK
jgi:hypothetical protein